LEIKVYMKLELIMEIGNYIFHIYNSHSEKYNVPYCNIHKYTWMSPNEKAHNQIGHILIYT
jgi:hypothetical protein